MHARGKRKDVLRGDRPHRLQVWALFRIVLGRAQPGTSRMLPAIK